MPAKTLDFGCTNDHPKPNLTPTVNVSDDNYDNSCSNSDSKRRKIRFIVSEPRKKDSSRKVCSIDGDGGFDLGESGGCLAVDEEFKSVERRVSREENVGFDLNGDELGLKFDGMSNVGCGLNGVVDRNSSLDIEDSELSSSKGFSGEEKGKRGVSESGLGSELNETDDHKLSLSMEKMRLKRLSAEEKGEQVVVYEGISNDHNLSLDMAEGGFDLNDVMYFSDETEFSDNSVADEIVHSEFANVVSKDRSTRVKERFKNFAKQNASKYAHFDASEVQGNVVDDRVEEEIEIEQLVENVDDLPGPFSTAMKLVRDREKSMHSNVQNSSSVKGFPLVNWTPRKENNHECSKKTPPSLISLCVDVLVENVDAISSLSCVPDAIRNTISRKLCDSRKMNPHFISLLLEGSPSEIRLADCSWLEERVFEKSFEACETKMLTVLQLELGGHCLSDSSLRKALISKGMEALTTISLKGACRISDAGLAALVSSAPNLKSINLSQCSLLTDVGIGSIANSLGSFLQDLYLDECGTLNAMRILPILKRLKSLEVLSLRGITSVSDKFIKELIYSNGQNMKELILANCVNLTDFSLKIIAEKCSQLHVLDLSYLAKLTDIGLAYLANVCLGIQCLKFDRCPLSDDAIAAFLETSGDSLKELSLNNIKKVGQNTTLSLARRCKNLESLDLSWCRSLTDEALGFIADSCLSLRLLKIFGCTQVTSFFVDGHSNAHLQIIGLKLTPILAYMKRPEFQQGPSQ